MNDYFGYLDSGRNDYFDYDDYFDSNPKTTVSNPKILVPMCDPNPKPILYIRIL